MSELLTAERHQSPSDLAVELSETFSHGSSSIRANFIRLRQLLESHLTFEEGQKLYSETIDEQRVRVLRLTCLVEKLVLQHRLGDEDADILRGIAQGLTGYASPTLLHEVMFKRNILSIFTPEQQAAWGPAIQSFQWLGCYAQTELGHGSNLRSLETTATFLPELDMLELNSPTLTSTKFWPGALGSTSNMAVVYARLLVGTKDYGVHSFLVQLRDFNTHKPLDGIVLGHIGSKMAFNTVDNGYLQLKKVLIPRTNMAMKFSQLSRDGVYSQVKGVKRELSYFTMLQMRFSMMFSSGNNLSKAATIAVRYSAVRSQGLSAIDPRKELQVIDYQSQQHRVFPRIAESYAILATSLKFKRFCADATEMVDNGKAIDPLMLTMAHATSCALKVVSSELCVQGIETCRRACGGHGYLQSSGLPELGGFSAQFVTAEGENYVISQQTTRTLLKILASYRKGMTLTPDLQVFNQLETPLPTWTLATSEYDALFQRRFLAVLTQFETLSKKYKTLDQAIQANLIHSHHLALCYGKYILVHEFYSALKAIPPSSVMKSHVEVLFELFAVTQVQEDLGDFLALTGLAHSAHAALHERLSQLLQLVRPHAVAFVDAFDHSDICLNSTLGRADGQVYEALMKSTQFYASDSSPAFTEFLQPMRQLASRL